MRNNMTKQPKTPKYCGSLREAAKYLPKNHTCLMQDAKRAGLGKTTRGWNMEQLAKAAAESTARAVNHVEPGSDKERKLRAEADILEHKLTEMRGESMPMQELRIYIQQLGELFSGGCDQIRDGVRAATRDDVVYKAVCDVVNTLQRKIAEKAREIK
jgi:hypothetical protein